MLSRGSQSRSVRLAVAACSAGFGVLVLLLARKAFAPEPPPIQLVDHSESVRALLAERAAAGPAEESGGRLRREPITEEVARRLFPLGEDAHRVFDPFTLYRYPANFDVEVEWKEHPDGRWRLRTNSLGMRRDADVSPERPDLRVLVTGDSHTEGFCNNAESFSGVLERALLERRPGRTIEVLNAAKSGYGFYNYLGVLEKYLPLGIDAFVVAVYGGNDLADSLSLRHYFDRDQAPDVGAEYRRRIRNATGVHGPAVGQIFNQVAYFAERPDEVELGLDTALRALEEMRRTCAEAGVHFLCVYLPPASSVEWQLHREALEPVRVEVGLGAESLALAEAYEQELLDRIAAAGIELIDARALFRDPPGPCYWKRDFHLNLEGHRRVAGALLARLEPLVAAR